MSDESILWRRLRYFLSPQLDIYHALAPKLQNKDVLEVGFGTGFGVVQYAGLARSVVALETDADAVAFARCALPLPNVEWVECGITTLWIPQRFDAAVMIEVLEHIPDWRKALDNVRTYLKPGGKLYISARNANADLRRNELHEREWGAHQFHDALCEFFQDVELYDYRLQDKQFTDTRQTPLIAVATKGDK